MQISRYFQQFFHSNKSSGILLMIGVLFSLLIANSSLSESFKSILNQEIGLKNLHLSYSVSSWINDGLMAVFFLLVGLEIKRELVEGELSSFKSASLPIFAAVGGMLVPALIFVVFNHGTENAKGWGIPMATDIAFSLAIISLLGKKVPASLKIFLAALAIVDDLGAIAVIAIFYTNQIHWEFLAYSAIIVIFLSLLNYLNVKKHIFYLLPGVLLWYFMHQSGIHATIAGVLLAFTVPTNISTTQISPLEKLEAALHFPVNFLIMPLFAIANTNITLHTGMVENLFSKFSLGIFLGLAAGKVVGINLFSFLAIKLKISSLPYKSSWKQLIGIGFLAGIGFTMSIFITILCFGNDIKIQDEGKFAILMASIVSGIVGYQILKIYSKKNKKLKKINS